MSWIYKNRWYIGGAIAITLLGVGFLLSRKTKGGKGGIGFLSGGVKAADWLKDGDFWKAGSLNLYDVGKSVGITLSKNKGYGSSYDSTKYLSLKNKSSIHWAVYDISKDKLIAKSENGDKMVYGASVSKAVVSANAFDKNKGKLSAQDVGKVIKLLVVSDNSVWDAVTEMGGGNDSVNAFSNRYGYNMSPARRKGNNISATGMVKFWKDVLRNNFDGAESIFKITSSCQTSSSRSRKCIPKNCYIGGKTGSYMQYNHDTAWIEKDGKFYAIAVLTSSNDGSDAIATMFGGLFNEYCK